MEKVRVAAVALNAKMGRVRENLANILAWTDRAASDGARLVLFPEAMLSGYRLDLIEQSALSLESPEIREVRAAATRRDVVVSFGLFERRPEGVYVTQLCVGRDVFLPYRKCHLTEDEKKCCRAGDRLEVQDLGFVRMGTLICYDTAFPRASETLVRMGAELLFAPTAHEYEWKEGEPRDRRLALRRRVRHVSKYWRARAYDYSTYAAYVDNAGEASRGEWFPGHIVVFGPDGEVVAQSATGQEAMVVADLEGERLQRCRSEWVGHCRALADSRPELYSNA